MLLGFRPAPMPVFAPIMPQWDLSGMCFLHMAPVNEFRLRCLCAEGWQTGRQLVKGRMQTRIKPTNQPLTGPLYLLQRPLRA